MSDSDFLNQQASNCTNDCPHLKWVFRLLVFAQVVLVALLMFASQPSSYHWHILLIKFTGLGFGLWAIVTMGRHINISPELKENAPLRKNGPYRFVRHPMYLALMIFCGSYVAGNFTAYASALWFVLLFVLALKIHYEERILRARFSDYEAYAKQTKRLIPFVF